MKFENICSVLETQAQLFSICTRIYENNKIIKLLTPNKTGLSADIENLPGISAALIEKNKKITVLEYHGVWLSRIEDNEKKYSYVCGPVAPNEISERDIQHILNQLSLPKIFADEIGNFLQSLPLMPIENFLLYTSLVNTIINEENVSTIDIIKENNLDVAIGNIVVLPKLDGTVVSHVPADYEENMLYMIKNGLVEEIDKLKYDNYKGSIGKLAPHYIRSVKNALISMTALCMRAAVSGGLDREIACRISDRYLMRIEEANSIEALSSLSALIRRDYCQRVSKLKAPKIQNLHILKATQYIQKNIYNKITTTMIAKELGIIPEYLGKLFKKELNCTVPEYITRQKIFEAKKLLRFTDRTLSEISSLLCFSSQSYFQRQFKKIRGITPAEYREKYKVAAKKK